MAWRAMFSRCGVWRGRMIDLLEPMLKKLGIGYRRLDGKMTSMQVRERAIEQFRTLPPAQCSVMLISTRIGGQGLNLTCANHAFIIDLEWNPAHEDQAIERVHRIGQTKPVRIVKMYIKNTIEERIMELQKRKRSMAKNALGGGANPPHQRGHGITVDDIRDMFNLSDQRSQCWGQERRGED
mmetsp:Transcript_42585/g.69058  ORF Transcript_42585/g.69058 Transcript_42585/m.69058 type:complete len:182 (+) Transcript_42585:360-905(+)